MTRTQAQKILGQGGILVCLKDSTPDEWWQARELVIQDSHKVEKIEQIINATEYIENGITYSYCYNQERKVKEIKEVLENIGE